MPQKPPPTDEPPTMQLYGASHSRASLRARAGDTTQFGSVRLSTLEDGAGRGTRILDFNTGSGLQFTVNVDRAMDIGTFTHNGRAIGWQSAAGTRHPSLNNNLEDGGRGWNRSFSGFLATCGLDHILGPEEVPGYGYGHAAQQAVQQTQHGRIANTPARLTGYGERWDGDICSLWAEGVVTQATLFGDVLQLNRKISVMLGSNTVSIADTVTSTGFLRTPHMLLYHVNLGYPLVDAQSRYLAPIRSVIFATHAEAGLDAQKVGYRTCPDPMTRFQEQVWQHQMGHDSQGCVPVAVVNDHLEFGLLMETSATDLPCAFQWQNFQAGHYVMGIEAATHHIKGNNFARGRDEMIWLNSGETRTYDVQFTVLVDAADISGAEKWIRSISVQPDTDYPNPSNQFPTLHKEAT